MYIILPFTRLIDVLEEDPENGNATFCRGLVQYDLNNYTMTVELFLQTLNITPNHSGALYNLGVLHSRKYIYECKINTERII